MNTRFRNFGTTAGLSAATLFLAAGAAFGAITATPDDVNRGPGVPIAADGDPALFVAYPRQIADPNVAFPGTNLFSTADASADLATGANDLRDRSIAAISGPSGALVNPELAFGAINIGAAVPVAANSYIIFFNESQIADFSDPISFYDVIADFPEQVATLDTIVNEESGAVVADDDLDVDGVGNDIDNDLVRLRVVGANSIDVAVDGYENFQYAIIVLADGPTVADALFFSEIIAVDQNPQPVQAEQVVLGETSLGTGEAAIYMVLNYQIVDDYDGGVANLPDSPIDTDLTNFIGVEDTSFDVREGTMGVAQTLGAFLADAMVFTDVPSIAGVQISQNDEFNVVLEIVLDQMFGAGANEIDDTEVAAIQDRQLKFRSEAPVTSITGLTKTVSVGTYMQIGDAGDVGISGGQLLQGSGQAGFGAGAREIWVAIDFDSDLASAGDADQFELVDSDGDVIATSDAVQFALPGAAAVPGIDDANLDGTADDDVIDEDTGRLFARFVLDDGDDAINSDATYSDEGQDDLEARATRESFSVQVNEAFGGTTAQTALSGSLMLGASAAVTDLARPIAIGFLTRAGETGDFCEFVDALDLVFDETIATNTDTSAFTFIGYSSGETVSDLTTGLGAGLSIPTIDIVTTATVNDRRLTPATVALATNFVNNDTLSASAPAVPVDGTANDGSTSILTGTGDTAYIGAFQDGAVADAGGRGATGLGTFNGDDELTGGFVDVEDGAAPALMGANVLDGLADIIAGFSEMVINDQGTDEAESLFVIMENDEIGRRFNIENGEVDFNGDNTVDIELPAILDEDISLDPGYNLSVFNPGHDILDAAGNASDPNVTKTKMVLITPPAAAFEINGVAIIDDESEKVVEIRLQVTGPVTLSENGDLEELADRFFIRGDDFNGAGGNDGDAQELGGLIADIEIDEEAGPNGNFTITLFMMDGMPIPQEDFYVEYTDTGDLEDPADSFLVTPVETGDVEIGSEVIYVRVMRPPSLDGFEDGNPLTMTIVGQVDLGDEFNALGAQVSAYVWDADEGTGSLSFVYKGVVHTASIDEVSDGEVRYFHPQLLGDGLGAVEPMGIINRKPELDITATVSLTTEGTEDGNPVDIEEEVLVYQGLDNLQSTSVVKPLRITFRDDPSCPGRFTFNGSGVTNGVVTYPGDFELIGTTVVTGDVVDGEEGDEIGPRTYALHTRGNKEFMGRPVVIVVEPEEFFAPGASAFLANNMLFPVASAPAMRALTFTSDIDRTGANALPVVFNIDSDMVTPFILDNYEQDDWAILPIPTNQGDRGTTGNLPNRVSNGSTILTMQANIPQNISARGAFVALDGDEPVLLDIDLALALDNRGVFCGDVCNLNRVASGYAYAIESDDLDEGLVWFTFGNRYETGATLAVTSSSGNGGWNLLANLAEEAIAAGSFGGQVNITMNAESGVRVWANGFGDTNDLEEIGVNEGVLVNTTSNFNSVP